jgi:ribose transport system substrate-binding protein
MEESAMKKIRLSALGAAALALVLVFTACSSSTGTSSSSKAKKAYSMAFLDGTNSNSWRTQCENEMTALANKLKTQGVVSTYNTFNGNNDATTQAQQLQQLVSSGVNAVFIDPVSATALTPQIQAATAKGVLVFGIDQHISNASVISVTNDQYKWAQIQADWFVKQLGGKGNIFWFDAIAGAPASDIRSQAFKDVLAKYPNIKVLAHVYGNWDEGVGKQLMTQLINTYPNYDGVLCQDGNAVGILSAVQEAGKQLPKAITSDEYVQYLTLWHNINAKTPNDKLNAIIVENPPAIGVDAMRIAVNMLEGKKLKSSVLTSDPSEPNVKNALLIEPKLVITNSNMETYYQQYKNAPDNSYIDDVASDSQINAMFQ